MVTMKNNHRHSAGSRTLALLAVFVLVLVLPACAPQTAAPQAVTAPSDFKVAFLISNQADPFYAEIARGAQEAGRRIGARLTLLDSKNDATLQGEQIQQLVKDQVDVLVIVPVSYASIGPAIQAANKAGIPVITVDGQATGGKVVTRITSDNLSGGIMAASYIVETLRGKGNIIELNGRAETWIDQQRFEGFKQGLVGYSDVRVLARDTGNFDRQQAKEKFARYLAGFPEIDAVFAHNDAMILGAMDAAREAGRLDEILFVGFDGIEEAVVALESGELAATIVQQPTEMGRLGVELAVKLLQGQPVAEAYTVELAIVTR